MIFESLWPLFFLAAVPVIIILYLLKPKGTDHLISSNLLWKKLLKNEQSRTFFEKFVHNILMYLQILIVALLVIALMSPFINREGQSGQRKILLVDTGGSMQHVGDSGKSRLEEAVEEACDYVRTADNTRFSIVTVDCAGANLLAVDTEDTESLVRMLRGLTCADGGANLTQAQGILDTLAQDADGNAAELLVYTDGAGAADFEELRTGADKELRVVGHPVSNVANEYMVYAAREDGSYDVMVSLTNYGDGAVSFDTGLYDGEENLIALTQTRLAPSESRVCLFEGVEWPGDVLTSKISGILYETGAKDSLAADNVSMAVKSGQNRIRGLLVGEGNIFLERAYQAVTGESIAKAATDGALNEGTQSAAGDGYNVVIYDAGHKPTDPECNRLIFGDGGEAVSVSETLQNVVLDMTDCDLTAGLSGFAVGVNTVYCLVPPEGAVSFLEYDGKCVGYYGERDGRREIAVGFDIRESDFPLRAEFPIFLANAMIWLSDSSWLAGDVWYAGDEILLQPWAEPEESSSENPWESRPVKAGLYQVGNAEYTESYVVRFPTFTESDGRAEAESVGGSGEVRMGQVKKTLRNLFLILALAFLVAEWIVYVRQMRYRGRFYLIVRIAVLACVILALAGIQFRRSGNRTATVFVVDLSDSNAEHREEMEDYLRKTLAQMPAGNAYGIVTFGKNAPVEQFLTEEKYYGGIMTVPDVSATNFEDAVSKALTLIPGDYAGRLVVLTDGRQTRGDITRTAQSVTASQTEFLTILYENEERQDVYIDNVALPSYLHPGDKYSVTVTVESNYETDAAIDLYSGSSLVASNAVRLNRGSNRFVFGAQVDEEAGSGSMESLRAVVRAQGDECEENDAFSAYSVVEAPPRILVISGAGTDVSPFVSVLKAAGCDYSAVSTVNAPDNMQAMLDYKSIVLVNTYIDDLPAGFVDNLESYVRDYGCGFVCCGGEDSFALGGYKDTPIETVLPVNMQLRSMNELPSMAMVMVIDHSGSMNDIRLNIAIKSATVAVDNLEEKDYVGVLTFDDEYEWQVELQELKDRSAVKAEIEKIPSGGGTTIKPALQEACRELMKNEATIKHVILLTDGMGETSDFSDVAEDYANAGITLSTVAVGSGSDTGLLETLAKECGGRYYYSDHNYTDENSDIPKIFAQEVFLGGDSYLQNGTFALNVQRGHELTANLFENGWPVIYGYVASTPKTASRTLLTSAEKDDPILTVWQYGLGRSVAWNSDVTGEWSGAFAGQEDYVQLWKRIADYSTGNADMGGDSVDVVTAGESASVVYRTEDYGAGTEILVTVIDPKGETSEQKLHATAPGRYEADLSTPDTGLYHFQIRREEDGEIQNYMTTAAAIQFSDEYKFDVGTDAWLKFVGQCGRIITLEDPVWTKLRTQAKAGYPLTNWFLALAVCLFVADVAMRRFQYVPKWNPIGIPRKKNAAGAESTAAGGTQAASVGAGSGAISSGADSAGAGAVSGGADSAAQGNLNQKRKAKAPAGTGKSKQAQQTLDTSQLLKKKDDRNI
ncbi:MAG: VWA domain-containing protein [Clostridium sp.]|nr:VWA domain-containing protein [Acetatifactor muris]MCM1526313.1 VWA domain-containing protein [Bacteroides sp.]MCM1562870.1 VWA domain-containing protein [Clostridium sp.]